MNAQPIEHVHVLAGEIGSRRVGTPGNQASAEYIRGVFEQCGLAVERNAYLCPAWIGESAALMVAGQAYPVYANTFSPACDVSGAIFPVGALAELEAADLSGKIVLLYGDLAKAPLSPRAFVFISDQDRRVSEKLERDRPAGVLAVNPVFGSRARMIEDAGLPVPSATLALETGLELIDRAGDSARLQIAARQAQGSTANLIARLPGSRPERIILCAHYDSKEDTPGAWDNASGTSVILTLAGRLSRSAHPATVEFIAFTGEEYWTSFETDAYLQQYSQTFGEIIAAINLDGLGGKLTTTSLATFSASPAFEQAVETARAGHPGVVRVEPWPASNHSLYFPNGVPCVAISSVGPASMLHSHLDTPDWISALKLSEAAALVEELVCALEYKDPAWGRA